MRSPTTRSQNRTKSRLSFQPAVESLESRITPSGDPLVQPPIIRSQNGVLTATLTESVGPARVGDTDVVGAWTYNGSYVGPTLMANPGDLLDLTIVNQLPEPTNLHTHGLHVSPLGNSDNVLLDIEPTESNHYQIQIPSNHPQGLYWYHPHDHGFVGDQISQGLSGLLVVGRADGGAPELNGLTQQLIELKNALIVNGQMTRQFDGKNNPSAQIYTVNGQLNPLLTMRPGEQQVFNVGNIGNEAYYDLKLVDQNGQEQPLYEVAEDGNPFTQVVPKTAPNANLLVPPGQRWSLLIQGGQAGQTWTLQTAGYNMGFYTWPATTLMTISFQGTPVAPRPIPTSLTPPNNPYVDLRPVPESQIAQQRSVEFEQEFNSQGVFVFEINGALFPDNLVFQPRLNTVEEWTLSNPTTDDHPFHLHTNPFQVVSSSDSPNGVNNEQDVVNVPRAVNGVPGKVVIRVMFRDFIGANVYHCHLVGHEDMGMMALSQILPQQPIQVVGSGTGGAPQVNVYDGVTHTLLRQFNAFNPAFIGGVNVAVGDVNNDGISDILCAAGPGGGPEVKVISGKDGAVLFDKFVFDPAFIGGVSMAAGDINGDGFDDIIAGAGAGGGPNVIVFSGKDGSLLRSFFAYDPAFTGGLTVAAGDVDGNGRFEIITGAGPGGGPNVGIFDSDAQRMASFFAFDPAFTGGVNVATGRVRGIGFASIICGAGAGGGPTVSTFQANSMHVGAMDMNTAQAQGHSLEVSLVSGFFAYAPSFTGGVRVGSFNQTLGTNYLAGAGAGGGPQVLQLDGVTHAQLDSYFALDPTFTGGVNVAGN